MKETELKMHEVGGKEVKERGEERKGERGRGEEGGREGEREEGKEGVSSLFQVWVCRPQLPCTSVHPERMGPHRAGPVNTHLEGPGSGAPRTWSGGGRRGGRNGGGEEGGGGEGVNMTHQPITH